MVTLNVHSWSSFHQRLSDVFDEEYEKLKQVGKVGEKIFTRVFFIPKGNHWNDILSTSTNIGAKINDVFSEVTKANAPKLDGILDKIDFNDKDKLSDAAVGDLINHFNTHKLGNEFVTGDMLGDAYEYLIAQFADDAGKKGGEFYTPHKVVELLVEILKPQEGQMLRSCVWFWRILVTAAQYMENKVKTLKESFYMVKSQSTIFYFSQDEHDFTWL